jgi:glycosyltransferase involved in cell wall biosynthesis
MPAHNARRFIDAAIPSIRDQTLADLELIVVNDGSSTN